MAHKTANSDPQCHRRQAKAETNKPVI